MTNQESAATKRARERNYYQGNEWYCDFITKPVFGLGPETGVHRRDPSSVLLAGGIYHVWYSKSFGAHAGFGSGDPAAKVFPWDYCDLWYATSPDAIHWTEQGIAVSRGPAGAYDDRSVFTPEAFTHNGKFYLVYQVVQHPYLLRSKENIAIAVADSPAGPFRKSPAPILNPSRGGIWQGEEDNRFLAIQKGEFDSMKVHDPCLFHFKGLYYLYYKGETMGEELFMGGRETKWGVAVSETPEGPYVRSVFNPVTNSGHETCLWQYKDGMAALLTTDGMERNTFQYAPDGINFEIMGGIKGAPEAMGPFRPDMPSDGSPLDGIRWGLCHHVACPWNYILRFEVSERSREHYAAKRPHS